MSQIKELYAKVAKDPSLQQKFAVLLNSIEGEVPEAAQQKLSGFAREAGYEIDYPELKTFLYEFIEKQKAGELSESELDLVAGGKSTDGIVNVFLTVFTLGTDCAAISIILTLGEGGRTCNAMFE